MKIFETKTELCGSLRGSNTLAVGDIVCTMDYGTVGMIVDPHKVTSDGTAKVRMCSLVPGNCRGAAPKGEMVWINRKNVMVLPNAAIIKDCTK